jgi:hypothetical protein
MRPPIAEIDTWVTDELSRLQPDGLAMCDQPRANMREEADRIYRRIVGVGG